MKKKNSSNNGKKLWKKAKKIIPGGNMLLSKRSEMFAPDQWNSYFKKSKKYSVWSLDGKKYIDMFFGVGTNILGYCNEKIDTKVQYKSENAIIKINLPNWIK